MADQRKVTFRHRVVLEFETYGSTGYNGDVEYLVRHAQQERYRYQVEVLPRSARTQELLKDITRQPPILIKESTTVVSVEVSSE